MADTDRIKRNISKMMTMGASEAEIDQYVASEGVTAEQLRGAALSVDKYTAQAKADIDRAKAAGMGEEGLARRVFQGATFGAGDEILAAAQAPIEMIRQGTFNPAEAYRYTKAREDMLLDEARERQGGLGTALEVAGGIGSGVGLAKAGATFMPRAAGAGVGKRIAGTAADGAAYGAVAGFNEGEGLDDRLAQAGGGAAIGAALGGALPVAGAIAAKPLSLGRAIVDPKGAATSHLTRAMQEGGKSADDVANAVAMAAREGQGEYTVADAIGYPGQRMLATVTKAPGEGRTKTVEFLEGRQAGQAGRVSDALSEGFRADTTAKTLRQLQETARKAEADLLYGNAREQAGAVDLTKALGLIDKTLTPGATKVLNPQSSIADDSIEAAVRRARSFLTDGRSQLSDFDAVLRAKQEIDSIIERATKAQNRLLVPIKNAVDEALEKASAPYAKARAAFRTASEGIDAIDTGRGLARGGRYEDTIATFGTMKPNQQAGARSGYADALIERVQRGGEGRNAVLPLTAEKFKRELPELADPRGRDLMMRRLDREKDMFKTRTEALGNSKTAENLADQAAMGVDPEIMANLLGGNVLAAGRNALSRAVTNLSGYTPAVRDELARLLLQRGVDPAVAKVLADGVAKSDRIRKAVVNLLGGALGGAAVTPTAQAR